MKCNFCGRELKEHEVIEFDGKVLCDECLFDKTVMCTHCGKRIWKDDNSGNRTFPLCPDCYNAHYTYCEDCGCIIHVDHARYFDDEDEPYCRNCYERRTEETVIHDYGYKPEPIFYGNDNLYFGVELEVDYGGETSCNAEQILNIANFPEDRIYIKHDGSIDNGFEIVTHPMTMDYHGNDMPWRNVFEKAIEMEYRSHQTSTCGLHIHVNRSAFGNSTEEREGAIGRIVYFTESHWNELLKFSRRTESNIRRWASRYGIADNTRLTYDKAKKSDIGRYVCINLHNYNTIEFRIFRGTLKYETFIATIQLVHEICNKAITKSDKEFESMSWSDFVKEIKDKKELINYLKSKQLYVNEEILESEEI